MHIIGIEGTYGSGKTTTAVVMASQWAHRTGAKLYANFPVRGARFFKHYEDWYKVADSHGSILIFDEAVKDFDSRGWQQHGQKEMTKVLNYVRKMNSVMIFILPDYNDLDNRIRNKTDIIIQCAKDKNRNIINTIYDCAFKQNPMDKGRKINQRKLPLQSQKWIWANRLFNTHSMVHTFPTPPPEKTDEFYKKLDYYHQRALQRNYGNAYLEIETIDDDDGLDEIEFNDEVNDKWSNLRMR